MQDPCRTVSFVHTQPLWPRIPKQQMLMQQIHPEGIWGDTRKHVRNRIFLHFQIYKKTEQPDRCAKNKDMVVIVHRREQIGKALIQKTKPECLSFRGRFCCRLQYHIPQSAHQKHPCGDQRRGDSVTQQALFRALKKRNAVQTDICSYDVKTEKPQDTQSVIVYSQLRRYQCFRQTDQAKERRDHSQMLLL